MPPDDPIYELPDDFDVTSDDWTQGDMEDEAISAWATEMGYLTWESVVVPVNYVDASQIRPGEYLSPQEAIWRAIETGIAAFSMIYYDVERDRWHLVVGPSQA